MIATLFHHRSLVETCQIHFWPIFFVSFRLEGVSFREYSHVSVAKSNSAKNPCYKSPASAVETKMNFTMNKKLSVVMPVDPAGRFWVEVPGFANIKLAR